MLVEVVYMFLFVLKIQRVKDMGVKQRRQELEQEVRCYINSIRVFPFSSFYDFNVGSVIA